MIVILMGVTGSGKTTVGKLLADRTGWIFADGDDYHSEANKQKMQQGIPLTDEDRKPWLLSLHHLLAGWQENKTSGILACSALKEQYRSILKDGIELKYVLLDAQEGVLEERLAKRKGHYMNPALLQSQLNTLELPTDAIRINVDGTPEQLVEKILSALNGVERQL